MSERTNDGTKGAMLVVGGCLTTLVVVILILVITTVFFVDTTKCSSVGRALPIMWGITAMVVFIGVVVVRIISWKVIQSITARWVTLAVYGASILTSYVVIALALLLVFNC